MAAADVLEVGSVAQLPPELRCRVLELLPPNEVACTSRLVCKDAASRLGSPRRRAIRLSQPLPAHAAGWTCDEGGLKRLTFRGRLGLLSRAAATGCEANLQVAWRLVAAGLFEELLPQSCHHENTSFYAQWMHKSDLPLGDPGSAAICAGHPQLLPWLAAHRVPLHPEQTLAAAARHCTLEGLQRVVEMLGWVGGGHQSDDNALVRQTAMSDTGSSDTIAKMQYIVSAKGSSAQFSGAGEVAASAGAEAEVLDWLLAQGCFYTIPGPVEGAFLCSSGMDPIRWMEERGLIDFGSESFPDWAAWRGVAAGGDVTKLTYLEGRRGLRAGLTSNQQHVLAAAARNGHLAMLQALTQMLRQWGEEVDAGALLNAAAGSGSLPMAAWVMGQGWHGSPFAYVAAARRGHEGIVRMLIEEARCPWERQTVGGVIRAWPKADTCARSSGGAGSRGGAGGAAAGDGDGEGGLLRAVQLLVQAGAPLDAAQALQCAAERGALELVQWLCDTQGAALDEAVLEAAVRGGCVAAVEMLLERGCPADVDGGAYVLAGETADRAMLECLRAWGVPWSGKALVEAAVGASLPVVRWLVDSGVPADEEVLREARDTAENCNDDPRVAEWLTALLPLDEE